jgi:hypothetical protein
MKAQLHRLDFKNIMLLLGIFVVVALLWNTWVVWPLKILVVFLHEISHGIMAWLTGGTVDHFEFVPQEGGLAMTRGGSSFLISSAGYLGSLIWGAFILVLASRTNWDKWIVAVIGLDLVLVTVFLVPVSNSFGFIFGLVAGVALLAVAKWLPNAVSDYLLKIVGITSCGYAILDIYSDAIARDIPSSDAGRLTQSTGIPAAVWGGLWIVLGVAVAVLAMWLSVRRDQQPEPAKAPLPLK